MPGVLTKDVSALSSTLSGLTVYLSADREVGSLGSDSSRIITDPVSNSNASQRLIHTRSPDGRAAEGGRSLPVSFGEPDMIMAAADQVVPGGSFTRKKQLGTSSGSSHQGNKTGTNQGDTMTLVGRFHEVLQQYIVQDMERMLELEQQNSVLRHQVKALRDQVRRHSAWHGPRLSDSAASVPVQRDVSHSGRYAS